MQVTKFSISLGTVVVVLALLYFFPWRNITWGKIVMSPERVVTVSGYAESKEKNQVANFNAGVNAIKDSKDDAVKEVNDKITALTQAVKDFGIDPLDIQTQSISIYQRQEYNDATRKSVLGQWEASNTIVITLRDVEKASELAALLTRSGATNVYGPNFQLDTNNKAEDQLMAEAIADARVKAEAMAVASGAKLDKVVSVTEGSSGNSVYPMYSTMKASGIGGAEDLALEPGSTTVSKTVTVVWSLK